MSSSEKLKLIEDTLSRSFENLPIDTNKETPWFGVIMAITAILKFDEERGG